MTLRKYPLATSSWDSKELEAMKKVIDSNMFTMGKHVSDCEKAFAEYVNVPYCVMVNSGSSANLLMVAALQYRKSKQKAKLTDKKPLAIVPAVSWATTYYPLHQYGYRMKFVDVDINTLNFDLQALENAIKEETPEIIMAVNLLGNPNDFDLINKLCLEHDIVLLEDNCESMGATFKGQQCGTIGLMGTYSTFFSHHISTMEGGFIVTKDEELYHILLSLRAHGWTRNLPDVNLVSGVKSEDWFEESFKFVLPGYNVRPLELSGAIGIEQVKKLPEFISHRKKNARYFSDKAHEIKLDEVFIFQKEIQAADSSWFGFSLVLKNKNHDRKELVQLLTENNIECRPIVAGNFFKNPVISYMDCVAYGELKNADYIHEKGLFVGNHHYDMRYGMDALIHTLNKFKEEKTTKVMK